MTDLAPSGFHDWRASPLLRFALALAGRGGGGGWPGRAAAALRHYTAGNPIATLEYRRVLRGRRAPYFVIMHLVMLGLFTVAALNGVSRYGPLRLATAANLYGAVAAGSPHAFVGQALFGAVVTVELYALFLLLPGLAAYAMPRERELHIFSDLRATLLTPGQIIGGRAVVAMAVAALLLCTALPLLAAGYLTGGISFGHLALAFLLLASFALGFTGIGLYCGSEFKQTGVATVAAYLLSYCAAFIFLLEARSLVQAILKLSWELLLIAPLYLAGGALLIVAARERVAGWHERGRLLRPLLLAIFLLVPLAQVVIESRLLSAYGTYGSYSKSDMEVTLFIICLAHYIALALFCARAPHPDQVRLPFFTALNNALRAPWREDPLGMPAFLAGSFVALYHAGLGLFALNAGSTGEILQFFLAGQAMLAGLLAYAGLALLLAFLLRTPRFISGASFAVTGIFLSLLFASLAGDSFRDLTWHWLSPLLAFIAVASGSRQDDLLLNLGLNLGVHLLAAYFAWRAYYMLWERRRRAGDYRLAGDDDHE